MLGATGRTGGQIAAGALAGGHEVSALVRDAATLELAHPRLRVLVGSPLGSALIRQAIPGHDAVLCALGPRSPTELVHSTLMSMTIPPLVAVMESDGARRLVLLSALGVGESARYAPVVSRLAFRTILRQVGLDKERAEDAVRTSGLGWTIVYPPSLTNGPAASYAHGERLKLNGSPKISRASVARFMLDQLDDRRYIGKGVVVGPR